MTSPSSATAVGDIGKAVASLPPAPPKPSKTPAIVGGSVGAVCFLALCVLLGFLLYRRRRNAHNAPNSRADLQKRLGFSLYRRPRNAHNAPKNRADLQKRLGFSLYRRPRNAHKAPKYEAGLQKKQAVPVSEIPSQNQTAWYEQPKDDNSMLRLYKEVNGRLTDHVLNFYIVSDGEKYDDEISGLPRDTRKDLEVKVSKLAQLLPRQDSRVFVLRAIIANRVMRDASREAGAQRFASCNNPEQGVYDNDSQDQMIRGLSQAEHDEMSAFAIAGSDSEARLHSMEAVVRAAVEFAFTMAKQPTNFEFVWALPNPERSSVILDSRTMEVVHQAPREDQSLSAKVRATVFPGLRKWQKEEGILLANTQVLLY